ncbi:OsmC family protein [Acidipropionibacterium timonense]|uniref:OsmC family protein n=1 Tax=Acidipropionibacterium timonense TaxID=2161818 RepID=UPI0010312F67|nr:OsmC family protein [Acidipropionibacterium timonense]
MPSATKKVTISRRSVGRYVATNARGGQIRLGTGEDADFTPVELLLAALGGCSSVDVDAVTSRRGEPTRFDVTIRGTKVEDEQGRHSLHDLSLDFEVRFPDTEEGAQAQALVGKVARISRDKDCTVSRTLENASPVTFLVDGQELD